MLIYQLLYSEHVVFMQGKSFQKFFFTFNHFVGLKMVNLKLSFGKVGKN